MLMRRAGKRDISVAAFALLLFGGLPGFLHAQAPASYDVSLEQLTLEGAEARLLKHNRDIRAAGQQLEIARAEQQIAGQRPNPVLGLDVSSINPAQGVGTGSLRDKNIEKTIRFEQLIERGDKRALRQEQASFNEIAGRSDQSEAIRQQRFALHAAYYDLLLAQEKLAVLQDIGDMAARGQVAAQHRLAAGDISRVEAARIRVEAARTAGDTRVAATELARARLTIASLIGVEPDALRIRAVDQWPDPVAVEASLDLMQAADGRPDVRAAQARLQASQAARKLALASRSRDLTVGASYKHYPVNPQFGSGSGNTYGVSVSFPLFLWHLNEGELRKADAERQASENLLDKTRAAARTDLQRARSDLVEASQRVARFDQVLLDEARSMAKAVDTAYRQGALSVSDFLDAQRAWRAVLLDAALARNDYAKALAAWRISLSSETPDGNPVIR